MNHNEINSTHKNRTLDASSVVCSTCCVFESQANNHSIGHHWKIEECICHTSSSINFISVDPYVCGMCILSVCQSINHCCFCKCSTFYCCDAFYYFFTKIGFVCCEFGSSSVLVSVRGSLSACVRVYVCFKWFSVDQPVWSMHTKRTTHNIPPKIHWCARWDHQPSVGSWLIRWTHFLV